VAENLGQSWNLELILIHVANRPNVPQVPGLTSSPLTAKTSS
jgi:hypothetical protein